jgi:sterol desaturase/sphingolipid hydroxylase (fatty acid hydroxylase superfamily)
MLGNVSKQILFFTITPICFLLYIFLGELSSFITTFFPFISLINPKQSELINSEQHFIFLKTHIFYLVGFFSCFTVEALILGWEKSSLKKISQFSTASARTDIFYIWLRISGLTDVLFNAIFLGFGFYFLSVIHTYSLIKLNNYFLEFIFTVLSVTFLNYVYHRVCHHKFFWELHKLHHSATEMNIFTASREHPLIVAISNILMATPTLLIGISPEVLFVFLGLQGIYNMFLHSKVDLFPAWAKFMITTKDHHIHHSSDPKHFSMNYGMVLSMWDKVFGTYYKPKKNEILKVGIEDHNYNKDYYFKEILFIIFRWIKQLTYRPNP